MSRFRYQPELDGIFDSIRPPVGDIRQFAVSSATVPITKRGKQLHRHGVPGHPRLAISGMVFSMPPTAPSARRDYLVAHQRFIQHGVTPCAEDKRQRMLGRGNGRGGDADVTLVDFPIDTSGGVSRS